MTSGAHRPLFREPEFPFEGLTRLHACTSARAHACARAHTRMHAYAQCMCTRKHTHTHTHADYNADNHTLWKSRTATFSELAPDAAHWRSASGSRSCRRTSCGRYCIPTGSALRAETCAGSTSRAPQTESCNGRSGRSSPGTRSTPGRRSATGRRPGCWPRCAACWRPASFSALRWKRWARGCPESAGSTLAGWRRTLTGWWWSLLTTWWRRLTEEAKARAGVRCDSAGRRLGCPGCCPRRLLVGWVSGTGLPPGGESRGLTRWRWASRRCSLSGPAAALPPSALLRQLTETGFLLKTHLLSTDADTGRIIDLENTPIILYRHRKHTSCWQMQTLVGLKI